MIRRSLGVTLVVAGLTLPSPVLGQVDRALALDGADDQVLIRGTDQLFQGSQFTVAAWVQLASNEVGRESAIVAKHESGTQAGFMLEVMAGGHPALYVGGGGTRAVSPQPIPSDQWHHLAGTYEDGVLQVWVNGALVADTTAPGVGNIGVPMVVGTILGDEVGRFEGQVDDVVYFRTALDQAAIQALCQGGLNGDEPGLVFWLPFTQIDTDASGDQVFLDVMGNHDGAVRGGEVSAVPAQKPSC